MAKSHGLPTAPLGSRSRLRDDPETLLDLLDGLHEAIFVRGGDGALVFVNDSAARASGYEDAAAMLSDPPAELAGRF